MKFLIQTIDGLIKFDFSLALINGIEYNNWLNNDSMAYELIEMDRLKEIALNDAKIDEYKDFIPIGSVEFVEMFIGLISLKKGYSFNVKPLNVPNELMMCKDSLMRVNIEINNDEERQSFKKHLFYPYDKLFIKSNETIKNPLNGLYDKSDFNDLPNGKWQVSQIMPNISSEWRCFVFEGKLLDVRNYLGDFRDTPDFDKIEEYIKLFKSAPVAYTLDICNYDYYGIKRMGIVECHDFFSCGLYGFNKVNKLPFMFYRAFKNIIKKIKIR